MKIRIWTLGSLERKIIPTKEALVSLRETLQRLCENDDGSTADLIWGPDLQCQIIDIEDNIDFVMGCESKEDFIKIIKG